MASDDNCECPLCMEPFEVDDTSFYPCTCGYQICRFCWHRLKIDGNGLCPACRKAYSENPAHFEPLSEDEIVRIKKERRHKEVQKKQKLTENRRHLSDVRVVQKNLVFVVGLSHRLADAEILKKHEYFGKFGKITKVVINSSPSYAGAQTPSASAYVTYSKAEEALKAIQTVNNVQIDNRVLKASLGTTKYCSHFLKGIQCPKVDCMYLHDLGEEHASFTKEQMSSGKHLEYESKLIENVLHIPRNLQNISNDQNNQIIINQIHNGLPSALLSHSSNNQPNQNNNNPTSSSSSSTTSNNNTTTATTNATNSTNSNTTATNSNTTATNSNTTATNSTSNNPIYKNDSKSRLKKPVASSSNRNSVQATKTNTLPSTKHNNTNTRTQNNARNSGEASRNTTEEDDDDEYSDEINSEEEANYINPSVNNQQTSAKSSGPPPKINTTTKSYLSALNTEEGGGQFKSTPVAQTINYKDMLEKNIVPVVNEHEPETNDQIEVKPTRSNISPLPPTTTTKATITNDTSRAPPIILPQNETSKPDNSDLDNQISSNEITTTNTTTHSSSTQHILFQEEDLGFDPWDEATRSLQDLMKIESNSHFGNSSSKPPMLVKSMSCDNNETSPNVTSSMQNSSSTSSNYPLNQYSTEQQQYFQQQKNQSMFSSNNNSNKLNDLQSFYKQHTNGGAMNTPEFNQLYQNHMQQQETTNNIPSTNDCNTTLLQKLSELINTNAKSSAGAGHAFNNVNGGVGSSTNTPTDFSAFNHENYMSKVLMQKQNVSSKQSQIAAPPGFSSSNIVFNSPISTSSTSSSASSNSSSVNNSNSTTPALNAHANTNSTANGKYNQNACLLNEYTNEYLQENSKQHAEKPTNLSNSLQDTFRSIFPNANISFGATKQQQQKQSNTTNSTSNSNFDSKLTNNNYSAKNSNNNNQWPDDPAIVSLNNGLNGHAKDSNSMQQQPDFNNSLYSNTNNNNPNKQLEQLSYLTSSLQQNQHQQQQQPNNINNLANLLKKQQNEQQHTSTQFNNSFLSQFQMLYQQQQLAQFQQNSTNYMNNNGNHLHNNGNSMMNGNGNGNNNKSSNNNGINMQDQMNSANKSIEDLHNYQQKLLLLNGNSNFNGLNGNSNSLLNNFLSNNDLSSQFGQNTNNMNNNYGYMMDSNQNIQSTNNMNGKQSQSQQSQMNANNQTSGVMNGMPSLLSMQQQSYMQQLLINNYNQNPTTAASNSNSD